MIWWSLLVVVIGGRYWWAKDFKNEKATHERQPVAPACKTCSRVASND
jgi:hypothetical protein